MNEISLWLTRQAQRERSVVLLEDALVFNRFVRYAIYRLRYFALRFAVDASIHILRFYLIFLFFSTEDFFLLILALAANGLVNSFW